MKQLLGALCFLLFTLSTSTAQRNLFLDLGYNHSNLKTASFPTTYGSGYYGGLYFEELISEDFELSTSLRYSNLGVNTMSDKNNFSFLDASFSIGTRPVPEMTLLAGLGISRLLNEKTLLLRDFDSAVHVGVKYNFKNVIIKAIYYRGLINQTPDSQISGLYTENIQLGLGFRLTSGKNTASDTMIVMRNKLSIDMDTIATAEDLMPYYHNYIGLTFKSFNGFDFLYKKSLTRNTFLRVGLLTSNFSFESSNTTSRNDGSLGLDIGIEWLKTIDNKAYFIHGPSIVASSDFLRNSEFNSDVNLGLKYNLGYYYKLADRFDIGGELAPLFTYSNANNRDSYSLDLNTRSVSLVVIYKLGLR